MLTSIYSLLSASLFVVLDAVDVALTEAAIGAGIATVLMVATVALTTDEEKVPQHTPLLPLVVVMATGAALIYGTLDMPHYGDPAAPAHRYVAPSLSPRFTRGNRRSECRHLGAGELPRLRHPGRGDGYFHCRCRRAGVARLSHPRAKYRSGGHQKTGCAARHCQAVLPADTCCLHSMCSFMVITAPAVDSRQG